MTRIWVYSAGDIWDAAGESEKRFASEVADWLEGDLRQSGVVDCAVKGWAPFRSEREHRGEPQAIVLLAGDWRRFTRRDYFAVANALALHESGLARLVSIVYGGMEAAPQGDAWSERYRLLWKRLVSVAALNFAGDAG